MGLCQSPPSESELKWAHFDATSEEASSTTFPSYLASAFLQGHISYASVSKIAIASAFQGIQVGASRRRDNSSARDWTTSEQWRQRKRMEGKSNLFATNLPLSPSPSLSSALPKVATAPLPSFLPSSLLLLLVSYLGHKKAPESEDRNGRPDFLHANNSTCGIWLALTSK